MTQCHGRESGIRHGLDSMQTEGIGISELEEREKWGFLSKYAEMYYKYADYSQF